MNIEQYLQYLNIYKKAYHELDEERKADIKTSMQVVFKMLPDCELAMIISNNQTTWVKQGNITTEQDRLITLYKRNNKFSRYKDGSGEVDPILFLLYNNGSIYTKEEAKLLLDPTITVHVREISNISETEGISRNRTFKL